jgi:hypothetical protein
MEYDNVSEMYCTKGHMVENSLKVLHQDPLPNVDVGNVEGDKKIGGNIACKTYSKDCNYGYDVSSCDDHDLKNVGMQSGHTLFCGVGRIYNALAITLMGTNIFLCTSYHTNIVKIPISSQV